jgi:hypothetical protein
MSQNVKAHDHQYVIGSFLSGSWTAALLKNPRRYVSSLPEILRPSTQETDTMDAET